jgi:hypothetical protein
MSFTKDQTLSSGKRRDNLQAQGIPDFESGTVVLSTGNAPVLKVYLTSTLINVDIEDKAFIKRVIAMRNQLVPQRPTSEEEEKTPSISGPLTTIRSIAEALRTRGITITVNYHGHRIATIGAGAHPTILQRITKTRGLAINSIYTIIKMVI